MQKNSLILIGTLLVLGAGCIRNPATHKVNAHLISPEAERKIGEESKKQILEQYHVIQSTNVNSYVNRVGQKLARVCDRPTVDYEFIVLDNDLVNAFAVPGGFVFVTRGLLEDVDDEAELAMVIGHEIGHVAAMHGVQMIQKEMGQNALTILGTIGAAVALGPEAMLMVANTADLFSSLYLLGYSRENELQADQLGLQYMIRAGYDPQGALGFMKKLDALDKEDQRGWDLYFRTHPSTKDRIRIIESYVGDNPRDESHSYTAQFQEMKEHLPKVDKSERGQIDGRVYRNKIYQLSMIVPANWVMGFYRPQALVSFQTADQAGDGQLLVVKLSSGTITPDQLAALYASGAGFQLMTGRDVLYTAGYGFLGHYMGASPSGQQMAYQVFTTVRRGRGYVLVCGAPYEKADSYLLDIEQILRGFKFG